MSQNKLLNKIILLTSLLLLVACVATPTPTEVPVNPTEPKPSPTPTQIVSPTPEAVWTPEVIVSPIATEPADTPEPTSTAEPLPPEETGIQCIGARTAPDNTQDLIIQINLPRKAQAQTLAYFQEFARPCDAIGVLGRFTDPVSWRENMSQLSTGLAFYSMPSLAEAKETAETWTDTADWFAYEIVLSDHTPESEKSDPAETSRQALEFARAHNLAYMVTPGRPASRKYAADLAQYADAYGLQAYGQMRDSPETFVEFVKSISTRIRAVNPDILFFVAVSTDLPTDVPEETYEIITRLLGEIDGVFIRISEQPESLEKLQTLVNLLRKE